MTKLTKISPRWLDHLLLAMSLIVIWGAIIYYFYALNSAGLLLTVFLTVFSFLALKGAFIRSDEDYDIKENTNITPKSLKNYLKLHKINLVLFFGYALTISLAFNRLISAKSDRALISPWEMVNYDFFWLYAISALILTGILIRTKIQTGLKITLISVYYFLSLAIAAIVYKIGYGFDPFVHQATMELIASKGVVLPKTPYYLGEYSLIILLSKISGLAIGTINRYLVPLSAALFLPSALFYFLKKQDIERPAIFLTILFALILSFSPFISTTPQNLSYLFLILAVIAAAGGEKIGRVLILSLATAAIHPLAGLPALSLSAFLILNKYKNRLTGGGENIIRFLIWLLTALSIPLALFFGSGATRADIGKGQIFINSLLSLFGAPNSAGRESAVLNFVYLLANNYHLIIIIIIAAGLIYIRRRKNLTGSLTTVYRDLTFLSSAILLAYFLSGQIIFDNIINYEQSGYANRLPVAIIIFLLPLIIISLAALIARLLREETARRIIWLIFGLGILSASMYISYPRFDKYFNSRGYSASANDIAAVKSIEADASSPYIALANQQVSAAALSAFGFNHYYLTPVGELYFYPIPTGSPLYQYYLDMVYKNPGRATMINAMDLTGVDNGYLVVNKYWYQSGRIINEAKLIADNWWTINDQVFIFKYQR